MEQGMQYDLYHLISSGEPESVPSAQPCTGLLDPVLGRREPREVRTGWAPRSVWGHPFSEKGRCSLAETAMRCVHPSANLGYPQLAAETGAARVGIVLHKS